MKKLISFTKICFSSCVRKKILLSFTLFRGGGGSGPKVWKFTLFFFKWFNQKGQVDFRLAYGGWKFKEQEISFNSVSNKTTKNSFDWYQLILWILINLLRYIQCYGGCFYDFWIVKGWCRSRSLVMCKRNSSLSPHIQG